MLETPEGREPNSTFRRVLREPTIHFVLLAVALFLAASIVRSRNYVIEVDRAAIERRIAQSESAQGLTNREQIEADFIYELVLAREARSLVLDDDPRIRDILVQTMLQFLRSDVVQPPTESELREYYEDNRERYGQAPALTVDEFLMEPSSSVSGERPAPLHDDVEPEEISSDALIRHRRLTRLGPADLTRLFDAETARTVFESGVGEWVGPFRSNRGDHWLRVREKRGGSEAPPLESVKEAIRQDWIAEREETRFEEQVVRLREKYTLRFTGGGAVGSTGSGGSDGEGGGP